MKRLFLIVAWCLLGLSLSAQTEYRYQYWFDNHYDQQVTGVTDDPDGVQPDAVSLNYGLHIFHIHFQDTTGHWSSTRSHLFFRATTQAERMAEHNAMSYTLWFDHDYEHRHEGLLGTGYLLFETAGLRDGLHTVNVRFGSGQSARLQSMLFFQMPSHNDATDNLSYMVWFDQNFSNRHEGQLGDGQMLFNTDGLLEGMHTIHIRLGSGTSARLESHHFYKYPSSTQDVSGLRMYYWFGTSTEISLLTPVEGLHLFDVPELQCGDEGYLHLLFKNDVGSSPLITKRFIMMDGNCCIPPLFVTVDSITETTARIHWDYNRMENFTLIYDSVEFNPDTATHTIALTDTMIFLTGLQPGVTYYYAIKTDCYDGENPWVTGQWCNVCRVVLPIDTMVCEFLSWHGKNLLESGDYIDTITNTYGYETECDSIFQLHLALYKSDTGEENLTACRSLYWHDSIYTASTDTAIYDTVTVHGCDSTVTLHLTLNQPTHPDSTFHDSACVIYQWYEETHRVSGPYTHEHTYEDSPCPSIDTLHLIIHPDYHQHQEVTILEGDSYTFYGQTYNHSGIYAEPLKSVYGCDSIHTLELHVRPPESRIEVASVCQGEPWHGQSFDISSDITANVVGTLTYRDTLRTDSGLDSVILGLELTVLPLHLTTPTGVLPVDGNVFTRGDIVLQWTAVEGASHYQIYLWKDGQEEPSQPTYTLQETHVSVTDYDNACSYRWRVEALNPCDTISGVTMGFSINKQPRLIVGSQSIAFGETYPNTTADHRLFVSGVDLTDSIRMVIRGVDSLYFSLSRTVLSRYGGSVNVSFSPSVVQKHFEAYIIVTSGTLADTVQLSGSMANYDVFTVSVPNTIMTSESPVPISGELRDIAGEAQSNVIVDVHVSVMGRTVVFTDTTDAQGQFSAIYTPILSECGYYEISVTHHGKGRGKTLASFNIPGISFVTSQPIWEVYQNDTMTGEIQVRNRCNITLHDVTMASLVLPDGLNIEFDTLTLSPFQAASLHYTLVGERVSAGNEFLDASFSAASDEGSLGTLSTYYYCHHPVADLQIMVDTIECAVVPGVQKVVDVALYNNTDSTFRNIQLVMPSGQTYLQLLRVDSTYTLAPHDSLFIPMLLLFPQGTPLSPIHCEVAVTAENTNPQYVPVVINVVSEAMGSLKVLVSNEFTYYNKGPYLSGAHVTVVDYYSLDTVAQGVTGNTGSLLFKSLPEGYYRLIVDAPENDSYEDIIQIKAGEQNFQDIILEYQAITFSWVVYQKDIDDNWGITLKTEYKTNVPKPVITIDAPPIDVPYDGSMGSFNLLITNHGLIDAYDAVVEVPSTSAYEFFPLFDKIDTIHALSSVVVPCGVRDKYVYDQIEEIRARGSYTIDTIYSITPREETWVDYYDTLIYIPVSSFISDVSGELEWTYDTSVVSVPRHITNTVYDSLITHVIYYDNMTHEVLLDIEMNPEVENQDNSSPKSLLPRPGAKATLERTGACQLTYCRLLAHYRCSNEGKIIYTGQTLDIIRFYHYCPGTYSGVTGRLYEATGGSGWGTDWTWGWRRPTLRRIQLPRLHLQFPEFHLPAPSDPRNWECTPCWVKAALSSIDCTPHPNPNKLFGISCANSLLRTLQYCYYGWDEDITPPEGASAFLKSESSSSSTDDFKNSIHTIGQYFDSLQSDWHRMVNDTLTTFKTHPEILAQIIYYLKETDSATVQELSMCYDTTVTVIDTATLRRYAERWNRTLIYKMRGWTEPSLVPKGYSLDFYYPNSETISVINALEEEVKSKGVNNVESFFISTVESMRSTAGKKSTCASVSLQFKQEFVMTREAFEGTLSVSNPHETIALKDLNAVFTVSDVAGNNCSDKFDISIIDSTGIDATDNSIAPNSSGKITVRFVPLMSAAPTDSTLYLFGGNIDYTNPYTSTFESVPLSPVQLTVTPSPHLCLDYFIPHDIISDDPLTSPVIEAMVPATIGLRVLNDGFGEARNIRVSSIQPEITENRLGLAVEFHMLNTMRNGTSSSQPLSDISLGNLTHKESQTLEYYLTSSLLGTLTVKDINVIHNSSINDRDMSLVDAKAHRLVKTILQYGNGADQIHDFLTTSITQPDSIFFSNGGATRVRLADSLFFDHFVEPGDTVVQVTMNPDSAGWSYGTSDDPGQGKYAILSCVRDDNVEIPLDNIWLTFVDLPTDLDPVYVNKMHLVDTLSAKRIVTYNVTFQKMKEALEVDTVICESSNISVTPLDSILVRFNKAIVDSTFTYADMSLKCNNGANLMDNTVEVHRIDDSTFSVMLAHKNIQSGFYVLKVMADSVVDADGRWGVGGKQTQWMRLNDDPSGDTVIYVKLGVVGDSIFSKEEQSMVVTHPEVTHVKLGFRVEPTAERIELYDADENLIGTFDDSAEPSMIYRLTTGTYIVRAIFFNGDTFQQTLNFENVIHY